MKDIAIITENFPVPWTPKDLSSFLGGSQECVVLLVKALSEDYTCDVFTYSSSKNVLDVLHDNILYRDLRKFKDEYKNIILFKVNPKIKVRNDVNVIYWSSDIEKLPIFTKEINHLICLTEYHRKRCGWKDAKIFPHGIDCDSLLKNRVEKEPDTMLYSSSLDRGLNTLLTDWNRIKLEYPKLKLYITYGFKISEQLTQTSFEKQKEYLKSLSKYDIFYLGNIDKDELEKMYWKCEYWCLPLNRADSELFCFNAVKSHFCECIPVVNRIGALTETVGSFIDYKAFPKREIIQKEEYKMYTWKQVVEKFWKTILI